MEVEVTLLSCADRLATRGRNAEPAIEAHLELARELMASGARLARASGPPRRRCAGDELARELGIEPGPELGRCWRELAGGAPSPARRAIATRRVELARRLRENPDR